MTTRITKILTPNEKISQEQLEQTTYILIDIGSGAVRFDGYDGRGEITFHVKDDTVRLGASEEIPKRQLALLIWHADPILKRAHAAGIQKNNILVVATEPLRLPSRLELRLASNRAQAQAALENSLGICVNVLSGDDEMYFYALDAVQRHPGISAHLVHCGNGNIGIIELVNGKIGDCCALEAGGCLQPFTDLSRIQNALRQVGDRRAESWIFMGSAFCSFTDKSAEGFKKTGFISMTKEGFLRTAYALPSPEPRQLYIGLIVATLFAESPGAQRVVLDNGGMREAIVRAHIQNPNVMQTIRPSVLATELALAG